MGKSKKLLLIAVLTPVLLLVIVFGLVKVSYNFVKPTQNFVYYAVSQTPKEFSTSFLIENNQLKIRCSTEKFEGEYIPKAEEKECTDGDLDNYDLFLYDVSQNNSKQISFDDAKSYVYENELVNPEGYSIEVRSMAGTTFENLYSGFSELQEYYLQITGHGFSRRLTDTKFYVGPNSYVDKYIVGWVK